MPAPGIDTLLLAAAAAFLISLICSTGGVTGAFLLVPFQISILGLQSPSVSATNHLYNVVAAPGGFSGYRKQRLILWPVAGALIAGTVPGVLLGIAVRIRFLPDPGAFRPFAGGVLGLLGLLLLSRSWRARRRTGAERGAVRSLEVIQAGWLRLRYRFGDEEHRVGLLHIFLISLPVGVIGGAYGVGGGVFTSAYLIGVCGLPVHTTAGATLLGTFVASCVGAAGFAIAGLSGMGAGLPVSPVGSLGLAMGLGGLVGGYLGSRLQRFLPASWIGLMLALFLLLLGAIYLAEPF